MKRKFAYLAVIIVTVGLSTPVLASGLYIEGHLGLAAYALNDLNDEIDTINLLAGSDYLDNITKGVEIGGKVGFQLSPRTTVGAGLAILTGSTDYGDASGHIEYRVPAVIFEGYGAFAVAQKKTSSLSLGGSLGLVRSAGSVEIAITGEGTASEDLEGTGLAASAFLDGQLGFGGSFSLTAQAGIRYATISTVKMDGVTLKDPSGSDYELDYNGSFVRIGLRITLN